MPPTRMLVKTKSAHATHSATDSHKVTRAFAAMRCATMPIVARRA